jgi:fatty-acyl-CoA synthase
LWWSPPCASSCSSKGDLVAWCRKGLASHKCPRYVVVRGIAEDLTGKSQKFKLRDMAKEALHE